jgi:hypothetical protein
MKINNIEGPDLLYHFDLIGLEYTITDTPDFYFFPLNDHYNTHTVEWLDQSIKNAKKSPVVVFYDLVNTGDWEHPQFCKFIEEFDHPQKIYLTVNHSNKLYIKDTLIVQWDFMWNRIKSYYTQNISTDGLHHYAGKDNYTLKDINLDQTKTKFFLNLCGREYGYRTNLYELLKNNSAGYISNRSKGVYLDPVDPIGAYVPVPNKFYNETVFSVYVESNCTSPDLIHITEKTFEPLIKGHFVLPFSNPGTIQRVREMGFQLPDFIDYSYDTIQDPDLRFESMEMEFNKLLSRSLDWYSEFNSIHKHNQQCLNTIPYDRSVKVIKNV